MERDLCANCKRWREQHYSVTGVYHAHLLNPPCLEYSGTAPSEERRAQKSEELSGVHRGMVLGPEGEET